jgi:hypothetical protein
MRTSHNSTVNHTATMSNGPKVITIMI